MNETLAFADLQRTRRSLPPQFDFLFAKPLKLDFAPTHLPTQHCKFIEITMAGRTIVDLSLYKAQIITWFQDENKTAKEIVQLLLESYDKKVALQTV